MKLPEQYASRFSNLLGAKGDVRTLDRETPYFLYWRDHMLRLALGERPKLLAGDRPVNQRRIAAHRNHEGRVSALVEARRYQAELDRPGVHTKSQVARRLGVSRARVVQFLNLLTLESRVIEFLDANFGDPVVAVTFTEHRLRDLIAASHHGDHWRAFEKILKEARSKPGIWTTNEQAE